MPHKKASTCTGYEDEIFLHIKPYIGRIPLQEVKAQHVQANVNALVKEGKAPATVRKAYTILHAALDQAVVNQMILRNPSEHTILPKMEQEEIRFFTAEEQRRFIEALPDSTAGRALYFILGTGLRMAELSGLRWSDINGCSFTVKQTIRRNRDFSDDAATRTRLESSTPKTKAGRRTIPLSEKMQDLLATQRFCCIQIHSRRLCFNNTCIDFFESFNSISYIIRSNNRNNSAQAFVFIHTLLCLFSLNWFHLFERSVRMSRFSNI